MKQELVTIVVPIYNVEKYLEKCIKSIINQTYSNLEILLINDGSQDNCLDICEKYKKNDDRIRIINQYNQGLSAARNTGIKNANGKYICFIDSDDYINSRYIELLLESLIKNDADISICDFLYVNNDGKTWKRKMKKNKIYNNIEAMKDIFLNEQNTEVMTWNKLYKTELFLKNNIIFPVGKINEDNFTTYKLYYYSKKIVFINDELYYYLQRDDSIMGKKFNIKRLDSIEAVEETKKFVIDNNIQLIDEIEYYQYMTEINMINNIIKSNQYEEKLKELIKKIYMQRQIIYKNKFIKIKDKIILFLIGKNGKPYKNMFKIYCKIKNRRNNK